MAEPTKQETEQVFKVLKAQKANKVIRSCSSWMDLSNFDSLALIAVQGTLRGQASHLVSISAWSVLVCIEIWASISVLFGTPIFFRRNSGN